MIYWRTDAQMTSLTLFFLFPYCIKQVDSMLPCVCSVTDHRTRQMWKKHQRHSAIASCALFVVLSTFSRHLWSVATQKHGKIESELKCCIYRISAQSNALQRRSRYQSLSNLCAYCSLRDRLTLSATYQLVPVCLVSSLRSKPKKNLTWG